LTISQPDHGSNIVQKAHPNSTNYRPEDVERIFESSNPPKTTKSQVGAAGATTLPDPFVPSGKSGLNKFPEPPQFTLSILKNELKLIGKKEYYGSLE